MAISDESKEAASEKKNHNPEKATSFEGQREAVRAAAGARALEASARNTDVLDIIPDSGEVSEVTAEDRNRKDDPTVAHQSSTTNADALASVGIPVAEPSPQVMAREVRYEIRKEMREMESAMKRLAKDPAANAYELSRSVELFRKMKYLLAELAYKSAEFIRNLWIAVSQGQKIADLV